MFACYITVRQGGLLQRPVCVSNSTFNLEPILWSRQELNTDVSLPRFIPHCPLERRGPSHSTSYCGSDSDDPRLTSLLMKTSIKVFRRIHKVHDSWIEWKLWGAVVTGGNCKTCCVYIYKHAAPTQTHMLRSLMTHGIHRVTPASVHVLTSSLAYNKPSSCSLHATFK